MSTRVSTSQVFNNAQSHITQARDREALTAEKAATQKELTRPSQSPSEWVVAANVKDDLAIREGVAKNATLATHMMTATENLISQLQDIVRRTQELTIGASGNPVDNEEKYGFILPEVEGLHGNLLQALNTKFSNRSLLGGFKSLTDPFDSDGQYQGDDGVIEIEIDRGLKVPVNVNAQEIVLGVGLENGVNIPAAFSRLVQGLRTKDITMVRSTLDDLVAATDQLSLGRTRLAGSMTEIQRVLETHGVHQEQGSALLAKIVEVDPIKVFSDLARDQTVLRAAIETNRKVLNEDPMGELLK